MTDGRPRVREPVRRIPVGFVVLGVALFAVQVGSHLVLGGVANLGRPETVLRFLLTGVFSAVVVGAGGWLPRTDIAPERYPRIAAWCVGIAVVILGLNLARVATSPGGSLLSTVTWAVHSAAMGAAGGVLFGAIDARAIERARLAERARVRAEQAESRQAWLEYLNSLLRHEVLNTANAVVGYSELLLRDHEGDEEARRRLELINRQSQRLTGVIKDVRLLIEAAQTGADAFEPVDLVEVIESAVEDLQTRFPAATVTVSAPETAVIPADELLGRVFSNLLTNAVEHHDREDPVIGVTVEVDAERATVRVADDGPGIPEADRETLFERERGSDHGLGLYLVRTLLEHYDGTIELTESGPDGSTFTVRLPRGPDESALAAGAPESAPERDGPAA